MPDPKTPRPSRPQEPENRPLPGNSPEKTGRRAPSLDQTSLTASGVNWILDPPTNGRRVTAQIRHRHRPAPALVHAIGDNSAKLIFDEPQVAVTPGQAVVFYEDDVVVGGGWID